MIKLKDLYTKNLTEAEMPDTEKLGRNNPDSLFAKIKVWADDKKIVGYVENYRLNLYNLRLKNQQLVFNYTIPGMASQHSVGQLNSSGIGHFYCGQGYRITVKNLKGATMFLYLSKTGRDLLNSKSQKICGAYASVDNSSVDNIVTPTDYI